MPRFKIKHIQPVWEETTIWVEVSDEEAEMLREDSDAFDYDYAHKLLNDAICKDEACIEVTGVIEGMDDELEVESDD